MEVPLVLLDNIVMALVLVKILLLLEHVTLNVETMLMVMQLPVTQITYVSAMEVPFVLLDNIVMALVLVKILLPNVVRNVNLVKTAIMEHVNVELVINAQGERFATTIPVKQ
jgi:hypothetical protein